VVVADMNIPEPANSRETGMNSDMAKASHTNKKDKIEDRDIEMTVRTGN
jgi:hypothetical protein